MLADLKEFQTRYSVFALLDIWHSNMNKMIIILDLLHENHIPFVLEAYSSDALTIPASGAVSDVKHGIPLSMNDLAILQKRYGKDFAGLRIFEIFAMDFTIDACKHGESWCRDFADKMPDDAFFADMTLQRLVRFAHRHGMFVLFADWYWSFDHQQAPQWLHQYQKEQKLRELSKTYPNTIVVMYDNNEPNSRSRVQLGNWYRALAKFVPAGAIGVGLSDQSWICSPDYGGSARDCPIEILVEWAKAAIRSGAVAIEVEPYWYWWKVPRPKDAQGNKYTSASPDGARATLKRLAEALGVGRIE